MPEPAPHAELRHVFVYGTLRRGGANDIGRLSPPARYVGEAEVPGRLFVVSWYPGLLLDATDGSRVRGEVYAITPDLEAVLDRIEEITPGPDSEYAKREVLVDVDGAPLRCLVYEINPERVHACARIDSGDWLDFIGRK